MGLPAEVLAVGRHNARRTGIDEADGISYTAQAWAEHPDIWRTVAHRRCIDERRHVSGRSGDERRALVILDDTFADGASHEFGAPDPGIDAVEVRVDLAAVVGPLPDEDVATLARVYWLGMPPDYQHGNPVNLERAKRHAKAQAVANAIRAGKPLAIVPPPKCPLSARELQIVVLVADGLTRQEIGERLDITANTVKSHLARITARVHAGNSAHVVAIAMRAGWIT